MNKWFSNQDHKACTHDWHWTCPVQEKLSNNVLLFSIRSCFDFYIINSHGENFGHKQGRSSVSLISRHFPPFFVNQSFQDGFKTLCHLIPQDLLEFWCRHFGFRQIWACLYVIIPDYLQFNANNLHLFLSRFTLKNMAFEGNHLTDLRRYPIYIYFIARNRGHPHFN
jgi:hypothetical protein